MLAPTLAPVSVIEPAAQLMHDPMFDAVEYAPAVHTMHKLAPTAVPVLVIAPARQVSQYARPVSLAYVACGQLIHVVCAEEL
jgi:hypothetical protein